MNVLVTGGAGFIGSHLVDRLVELGHDVRVFDNLEPQVHTDGMPDYLNKNVEFVKGDICSKEDIKKALQDIEIVFHQASAVGVGQSMYQIEKYVDINTMGTAKLLDIIVNGNFNIKKLIVASSMSIYGEGVYECANCGVVYPALRAEKQLKSKIWEMKCSKCNTSTRPLHTSEEKPLKPTSIYAITKKDQEEMCLSVGNAYGIPTVALRYFNVYGPRQSLNNPYTGVCAIFSSRIKNNNPPVIFEDGLQTRDFVNVKDIVQANILAMEKKEADYNVFNVGSGKPVSILDIANVLAKLYGRTIEPQIINKYRPGDIRHCFADISKIRKLGFQPSVDFEEGMKELVVWGEQVAAKDMTDKAHEELEEKGLVKG